jgi:hypothetical protein
MTRTALNMTAIRRWHSYMGLFMAPSLLFFALTGAAQIFSLHEAHGNYRPPAIVEKFSSVHKDQVFKLGNHHQPSQPKENARRPDEGAASQPAARDDGDKAKISALLLKSFFLLVAVLLFLSTGLGVWMGLTHVRQRRTAWMLVLAGALIPASLLLL